MPWKMIVGHFTFYEALKLSNLSSISKSTIRPYLSRATSLTDLIGEIKDKQAGLNLLARWHAGPEPIDLPEIIISYSLSLQMSLTNE
jgi:hypothetical protein